MSSTVKGAAVCLVLAANGRPDSGRLCNQYQFTVFIQYSFIHGNVICQDCTRSRLSVVDCRCKADKLFLGGNHVRTANGTCSVLTNHMLLFGCIPGIVIANTALGGGDFIRTVVTYRMPITCIFGQGLSPYRIARTCRVIQETGYLATCKLSGCFAQNILNRPVIIIHSTTVRIYRFVIITVFDSSII